MELTVDKDLEEHTLTVVATFDHPVEQVWDLYADPRKMERWWGPPTYPATVVEHSLTPGGVVLCESERGAQLPETAGELTRTKQYTYGKILVSRYEKAPRE